jgi:hypothetical protein
MVECGNSCPAGEYWDILALSFRWGPELRLWIRVVVLCVTHHSSADEPDEDTCDKKHTTDIPGPQCDLIDQVLGQPKREQEETYIY